VSGRQTLFRTGGGEAALERTGGRGREQARRSHPANNPQVLIDTICGPIHSHLLERIAAR
jgi:hypothetical protein